ncbi:MAG: DUF2520 domain-containing protein [Myxococcaceae bacterium]|nr:DUF2520 domain-containing protein [Myxococcaceae bacterium]MBH2006336.1 DUF2520 domain-containing protein [Myxococcaceae bacterium]
MSCSVYALGQAGSALSLSLKALQKQPDVLFLSVPDHAIEAVAQQLAQDPQFKAPAVIAHLSGSYSWEVLGALKEHAALAQFHPLAALKNSSPIPPNSLCAISSNCPHALHTLQDLARKMQLRPIQLSHGKTIEYHTACTLTGNLTLALVQLSIEKMAEAGVPEPLAREGLASLLHSVASNLESRTLAEALTGPVKRGDQQTIERHLSVLHGTSRQIYEMLTNQLRSILSK